MKIFKFLILPILILLVFSSSSSAQEFEYGKPAEMKGLTKLFIDTGPDTENFERIKKVFDKAALPDLEIVESVEEADFIISFKSWRETVAVGGSTRKENAGKGFVAVPNSQSKKLRILMNFESVEDTWGEQKPATKFARKIVEQYKKANGIK